MVYEPLHIEHCMEPGIRKYYSFYLRRILNIKISSLILFQLDSSDEQAAAIRRELDARREKVSEMERVSDWK